MNLLFEEDGAFKTGSVLSGTDASFQVELASGKRSKVKASHVLLRFEQPTPAQLMQQAQQAAEQIDLDFLWECAPQDEFGFEEFAREYHGRTPSATEAAAILMRLHAAPVYFHRKGRGRFRPAPAEILKQALAAVERKRQQELQKQQYVEQLKAGELPSAIAALGVWLIVRPDKNSIEYKALEQAAAELQLSPLRLLLERGAIASAYRWHLDNFLVQTFPRGTGFSAPAPEANAAADLPLATVAAFSIDDSATTEIDDAFSVQWLAPAVRVGIHIAAPALCIQRADALDAVARGRMSTVYAPGLKYTMLPPAWIEQSSLNEGQAVAALSLYVDLDPASLKPTQFETVVERVPIAANLRYDLIEDAITDEGIQNDTLSIPYGKELALLWKFARVLLAQREAVRGKPENFNRLDYNFALKYEGAEPEENAQVIITPRKRGAPLDLIVAELMILVNSHWGEWLAQHKVPGIYRSQTRVQGVSRVKMSTTPAPHEGLGVAHYAWSSSPLRRYVDLVNQRQLIALTTGEAPPYAANDAELFAVVSGFETAYSSYADFQARLERYWCLRWLQQNQVKRIAATVVKEDLLRLDDLPFLTRVPGLPTYPRGQRLEIDLLSVDEIELSLEARLHRLIDAQLSPASNAANAGEAADADDNDETEQLSEVVASTTLDNRLPELTTDTALNPAANELTTQAAPPTSADLPASANP